MKKDKGKEEETSLSPFPREDSTANCQYSFFSCENSTDECEASESVGNEVEFISI